MAARGDMELVHTEEGTFNIWTLEVGTGKSTSDLFHLLLPDLESQFNQLLDELTDEYRWGTETLCV